jgi:hypothetical protein
MQRKAPQLSQSLYLEVRDALRRPSLSPSGSDIAEQQAACQGKVHLTEPLKRRTVCWAHYTANRKSLAETIATSQPRQLILDPFERGKVRGILGGIIASTWPSNCRMPP